MLLKTSWVLLACLVSLSIANSAMVQNTTTAFQNIYSSSPVINTISVEQTQHLTPISIQTTSTTANLGSINYGSAVITALPQPTPILNQPITVQTPAYGQITIDQSGVTQAQLYSPNCAEYVNGQCIKCSFRFVRAFDGICEPVNPLCATWDVNGACQTCYPGYEICENGCIMTESCAPGGTYDPNCRNTVNGVCQQCSQGYYFNQNGICTEISPFCRSSDNQGNCLSCYAGYGLNGGSCIVLPDPAIDNPYCTRFVNNVCQQCSNFSWNNGIRCVPFDPMCSRTDVSNGNCLSCYSGYLLGAGKCTLNTNTQPNDLLCRRWNTAGVCIECSGNAFLRQNMCVAVDALCRTFERQNGNCISCYAGYNLQNGRCVVIPPDAGYQNTNQYCAVWDGQICRQCAQSTYFNTNRICTPVNPYCATTSPSGQCLSCYNGFALRNNNCTVDNTTINVSNALCSIWSGLTCQQCATRTFNFNGVCTAVNTLCNTWSNQNGNCLTCYNGYILNGNTCVLNDQAVSGNPLCKTFNGPTCIECANRAYFANGICRAVDNSCATWSSQNGQCLTCYNGFALQNGLCVSLPAAPAPSINFDIYCARTDSAGRCIKCFYGFALINGSCVADFKNTPCARNPAFCK